MSGKASDLESLRKRIDEIDTALHDLLMERARIVEEVARAKSGDRPVVYRPVREAAVLRRLLSRHSGNLPSAALIAIWREIISASVAMQGTLRICADRHAAALARAHFGSVLPIDETDAPAAVTELLERRAGLAVLSLEHEEPGWLDAFTTTAADPPRIVALLPVEGPDIGAAKAVILSPLSMVAEEGGASAVLLEISGSAGSAEIAALADKAGLPAVRSVTAGRTGGGQLTLMLFDGFVPFDDPRLSAFLLSGSLPIVQGYPAGTFPRTISVEAEEN